MPGIHVRTLGRLHWEDKNKEPSLTVPGSYWLCHKNNIYKFTFKFHRTIRNTVDFCYSKELMKIIRRVIKWQPRQGQHFSTKNLLVTYNHASWTRQDKMFAVMKFCDRPDANAFPHAFILTVKVLNQVQPQQTEETMGGSATKPSSENPVICSLDNDLSPDHTPSDKSLENKEIDGVASTNRHHEEESKHDLSRALRPRSRLKDLGDDHVTTNVITRNDEDEDNSSNSKDMDCSWQNESTEVSERLSSPNKENSNPVEENEESNCSTDSQSDSASLPYQYLIERDIERELENSRIAKKSSKENDAVRANGSTNLCDSSFSNEADSDSKSSRDSRKSSSKLRSRQESKDSESMPPDVANLRSSNITDLVMKGLMFTIRQDKDMVTVVEQKTKLEVDEVLENSEKVETKEGDPCLLNSSLLRLEKMITRMQEPIGLQRHNGSSENALVSFMDLANEINMETEERLNEADIAEKEAYQSTGDLETANCWSQFFTNKEISDSTFETIEKALGDSSVYIHDDNQDEDLELRIDDEEEEDIIPEALVHHSFFDSALETISKAPTSEDAFQDLLMDDIEPIDTKIIDEEETAKITTSSHPAGAPTRDETNLIKDTSKLPKVISNKIITNDQIPPALLKVLKCKSTIQQLHSNEANIDSEDKQFSENNNEINIKDIENTADIDTKNTVQASISNNVENVNYENMDSKLKVTLERYDESYTKNNTESCTLSISVRDDEISSKSSFITENMDDEKSRKNTNIKTSDICNTNSHSVDNIRLTRSNSKLYAKSSEISSPTSNSSTLKDELVMEMRGQKTEEETSDKELHKALFNKPMVRQKRRKSMSDQCVSKFCKSVSVNGIERKEVKVKVWKLISDITHGVKVVVERMDVAKIPR